MAFGFLGLLGRGFGRLGGGGAKPHGGPFLLLVNATSKLLLFNGVSRLLITGQAPSSGYVPTYYLLGF